MRFLTQNFFRGILFLLPITLTVYIIYIIFSNVDLLGRTILGHWIEKGFLLTGIGFIFSIGIIVSIGYFSSWWIGEWFFSWIEKIFHSGPVISGIYGLIRDTVHSIFGKKKFLSQAVLVDLPALGYKRIGFITQESVTFAEGEEEKIIVYMPHSFQVSGEMVVIPKKDVKILNLAPDKALKMIMSAGIVQS